MKKRSLEIVYWRDAHFEKDGFDVGDKRDYIMRTVGWTKRVGRWLEIASERQPGKAYDRAVTRVPLKNVVKRRKLK